MRSIILFARPIVASSALTLLLGALDVERVAAQRVRSDSSRRDSIAVLPTLETIATIRPAAATALPSSIAARLERLDARALHTAGRRSLGSLLEQRGGFSVYDDLGSPYKLTISSRGFAASPVVGTPQGVAVFLDGIRMNEPDAAQVNFDLLPTEQIDHIEILSGNGTLLGRNAIGGGINLVTARGRGPTRGELSLTGASFGGRSADASVAGRAPFGMDYYVGASANRESGWRQLTSARLGNTLINLDWSKGQRGLRLGALRSTSRAETAGSLPESVFGERPDSNLTAGDYEDLNQTQVSLTGYTSTKGGRASLVTYVRRHSAERFNVNQADDPDALGSSANTTVGGTLDYQWNGRPIGRWGMLNLRVGADGAASRTAVRLIADSAKLGGARRVTTDVHSPIWDVAAFGLADLRVGRFTWSSGVRYDHVAIPYHDRLDPDADTTGIYDQISPRLGLAFDAGKGITAYASIGNSFRAPALIENACADPARPCPLPFALGDDPPLRPVRATSFEAGASYSSDRWQTGVNLFRTNVRDDIFVTPSPAEEHEGTIDGYFVNLAKTRRVGIESNLRLDVAGRNSLYAVYSYTRATFQSAAAIVSPLAGDDDDNVAEPGDRLPLVPAHQLRAGADTRITGFLSAGVDGRYVGTQWLRGDEANNDRPLDGYFVADARASFTFKRWELIAGVSNVLGRKYAVFGTYNVNEGAEDGSRLERFLTPGAQRGIRISVRHRFGAETASRVHGEP